MPPKTGYRYEYTNHADEEVDFACTLDCEVCTFMVGTRRCKRIVCIGLPMCWQHARKEYGIRIGDSPTIPGEKGLIADRDLPKNKRICPYGGENLTNDELYKRSYNSPYTLECEKNNFWDGACKRGIGSMANANYKTGRKPNAKLYCYKGEGYLKTLDKTIKEGTEILVSYGRAYNFEDYSTTTKRRKTAAKYYRPDEFEGL